MNDQVLQQIDAFTTPGRLLKQAREAQGMSEREAADRLNLMPDYVAILERDDYQSLRSPAFAKGYVRAYGRLLDVDEQELMHLFAQLPDQGSSSSARRIETKPLQLQHTGIGVVVALFVLLVFVTILWWRGATPDETARGQMLPGHAASAEVSAADLPGFEPLVANQ